MEELLRIREKEEENKAKMGLLNEEDDDDDDGDDGDDITFVTKQDEKAPAKVEEVPAEVEEEDDDDDGDDEDDANSAQSSFGSIEQGQTTDQQKGKPGKSPFSASSLAFASSSLISAVPSKLQLSFSFWNKGGSKPEPVPPQCIDRLSNMTTDGSVNFRPVTSQNGSLKAVGKTHGKIKTRSSFGGKFLGVHSQTRSHLLASANSISNLKEPRVSSDMWLHAAPERDLDSILSLHSSLYYFEQHRETIW